ncbi:Arginyl-tRNA--protein transferase 1 [Podospora pseudopauciseta]|uniref:arginyltransferase n=2 Tax=Podospora TaxID=5144 RepID=A0ABR0HHM4_9PEZI|nr:Arginyl-tRNA--protein transferase 1 [Podospora pseudopauciseta]KAK4678548.1 Arginyl-tRNA--protein transferase 1 [Podospora pseudoanserina]
MAGTRPYLQTPDDAAAAPLSYIYPIGYSNSSECGYCRASSNGQPDKQRWSYYAVSRSLEPAFYQKLVDRFWRRSGTLLYRPNQKNSCCPHYTLRLDSAEYKPTKDQRQALNRFNRHILGDTYARDAARLYPRSREQARKEKNDFDLVSKVHESEAKYLKGPPPAPSHEFSVTLEPDAFTDEKYKVFENYQRIVHREPPLKISRVGFRRFLCDSPLTRGAIVGADGTERKLGSYHQCYRIDGELVAVGVLDLLPNAVSAVYFMYHESIHFLNPGKLGAMREIALAREAGYRWWYPGYYVHTCAKMRYKIDYRPQYVLDPETLQWDPLDEEMLALYDKHHYVSLSRERRRQQQLMNGDGVLDDEEANNNDEDGGTQQENDALNVKPSEDEDDEEEGFLLTSDMPGIPSLAEMEEVDMGGLLLKSDQHDRFIEASELVIWDSEEISQHGRLKSRIAELVAAIGPDLMGEICIDFRKKANRLS